MDHLKSRQIKADLALLFVAFSWGITFIVVQDALSGIGVYYFLGIRFLLAFIFLAAVYYKRFKYLNMETVKTGVFIGLFLFAGYAFQTVGLKYTGPATAGFITGLNVIMVPIIYAALSKKPPSPWGVIGVTCAAAGLSFLTLHGTSHNLNIGDLLVFFCAICFASHIIAVGHFAGKYDAVLLTMIQIAAVSIVSFGMALGTETFPAHLTRPVWTAFIVCAIPATSLAFLIQNSVQKYTSPTHTAIIFTMEPVFAALSSHLLSREILNTQQAIGCLLILAGMLVSELKTPKTC
ncbi:MAG: DMT family transporter [Clostridiales bacterium]|nr:DMT family transporter [Clostridiales bacterium]MCF8023345.1 DMT family transporter [Clostridiales bacterium]